MSAPQTSQESLYRQETGRDLGQTETPGCHGVIGEAVEALRSEIFNLIGLRERMDAALRRIAGPVPESPSAAQEEVGQENDLARLISAIEDLQKVGVQYENLVPHLERL